MDTEEFTVSSVIPASPNRIYSAWMDERHHSAFTGARATVDPWVGGRVVSDDGFIDATHVYLVTGSRIAMTWRTRDFPKDANDSQVDITFEPVAGGTKIEVTHTKIPAGLGKACEKLWKKLYLDSMTKYFGEPEAMRAAYKAAKKAGHLPLSGIKASRPAPRRPFVPPSQLPIEDVEEEDEEEKPKKTRKRVESKTIDLRELARAQAEARKEAAHRKAEVKRKAEVARRQAEADVRDAAGDMDVGTELRAHEADRVEVVVARLGIDSDGDHERIDVQVVGGQALVECQADDVPGSLDALGSVAGHRVAGAGDHDRQAPLLAQVERLGPLHRRGVDHRACTARPGGVDGLETRLQDGGVR